MGDRRPLATREYAVSKRIASWIASRGVSANAISGLGMIAGIAAGAALWATSLDSPYVRIAWIGGAVLVQLRLLANMFDGMVAIEQGKTSSVGELYNEVPDRISDTAILIGLGYAVGGYVAMGYAAALAAMFTAYVRAMGKVGGAEQQFCGPMAKPQRMFVVTLVALYCGAAPAAWQPTCSTYPEHGIAAAALVLIVLGSVITALRRLARIATELRKRDG